MQYSVNNYMIIYISIQNSQLLQVCSITVKCLLRSDVMATVVASTARVTMVTYRTFCLHPRE